MRVGADLHVGAVLALVAEGVHVADDREGDLALVPASCGQGPTLIIWCTAGVSGRLTPAMSAILGLHTPQAMTTVSASMSPPVVQHLA